MKQTAKPYTPRTVLATPVATLGEPLPKPPRKNAKRTPRKSPRAHDACVMTELQAEQASPAAVAIIGALRKIENKQWSLTKDAETGRVTLKLRAPAKPRQKAPPPHPLDDTTFDADVPLPTPANGKNGTIEKAVVMLGKMQPGQSKQVSLQYKCSLQRAIRHAHKTSPAKFVTRLRHDSADTMRVWRTA